MNAYYLGIDMGSVSTNLVLMNPDKTVAYKLYLRSKGRPVDSLAAGFLPANAASRAVYGSGDRSYRKRSQAHWLPSRRRYCKK